MSELAAALLAELDDDALDALAKKLVPLLLPHLSSPEPMSGWLRPAAAADHLGVTKKRVHDLTSAGAIVPDGRDGRTPLFLRETLDAYARSGRR